MDGWIYYYHRQYLLFKKVRCLKHVLNCVGNHLFPTWFYIYQYDSAHSRHLPELRGPLNLGVHAIGFHVGVACLEEFGLDD